MLKKTITYQDLDGNSVTDDFYFNISKAELAEMELSKQGGMEKYLTSIVASQDGAAIIEAFKDIIAKSVGKRSEDGRRFMKSEEISREFMETDAYSQLFLSLVTDATAGVEFIAGIMPADLKDQPPTRSATVIQLPRTQEQAPLTVDNFSAKELMSMGKEDLQALYEGRLYDKPDDFKKVEEYTREELLVMPQEHFDVVAGTDPRKMPKSILMIAMMRKLSK